MRPDQPKPSVIYTRVSGRAQVTRGDGLASQATRCRETARTRGYEVIAAFSDDRSGALIDRPGMKAMLSFLRKSPHRHVVLIDDISRLARGVKAHIELRSAIALAGGMLESPNLEFGDDADSELQEFILATVAQHHRRKNAEQTANRMRARVLNGYWPFACPIGYRYEKNLGGGKILVPNEPLAAIMTEALEGYASGRFQLKAEVQRFLASFPSFPRDRSGEVHSQRVIDYLNSPIYASYIAVPKWGIALRPGQHAPLISYDTHLKIQSRLNGAPHAPARQDHSDDFALRGFVVCADCGTPLTSGWSTGRSTKYAYYYCRRRGCASYAKSIRRDKIEGEFEELLRSLRPLEGLVGAARATFEGMWTEHVSKTEAQANILARDLTKTDRQVERLLDRVAEANAPLLLEALAQRVDKLAARKRRYADKLSELRSDAESFDASLDKAVTLLSSPWRLWNEGDAARKRLVLKAIFGARARYSRAEGFVDIALALPFERAGAKHPAIAEACASYVHDQSALRRILDQSIVAHSAGA